MNKILPHAVIKQIVDAVSVVERLIANQFSRELIFQEEDLTASLVSNLDRVLQDAEIKNVKITVKTFSKKVDEPRYGADFGVLININHNNARVSKFALFQSKKCECNRGLNLHNGNISSRAVDQVKKMLNITSSSYILVFTQNEDCGVVVYPAADCLLLPLSAQPFTCKNITQLHGINLRKLFESLLKCYSGHYIPANKYWDEQGMKRMVEEYDLKRILLIMLTSKGE